MSDPKNKEIKDYVAKLPPETREVFNSVWGTISPADKKTLQSLLDGIPSETNLIKMLIRLSATQIKMTFGNKRRVAIVGPANVGKSTFYNQLIQNKLDRAEVSPLPGTTRVNQEADSGLFVIVDTPGADAAGEVGEKEQEEALLAAKNADFLIILFDAIQGIKKSELALYDQLMVLNKPYVVAMNKIDLVRKETPQIIGKAASSLRLLPEQVIPVVAKTGENMNQVLTSIVVTEPAIIAALGQALPQYRWQLAWKTIASAASISAVIALAPLPVLDFAPLLVTQSVMVLGIARIYNYKITLARARELIVTFGLGFLGRTLFQELSKMGGIPGWLLAAAIASSTTVVMGYAASIWFERSQKLTGEQLKKLTDGMTAYLIDALKNFRDKKPGKESLKERIENILKESPLAQSRDLLDENDEIKVE